MRAQREHWLLCACLNICSLSVVVGSARFAAAAAAIAVTSFFFPVRGTVGTVGFLLPEPGEPGNFDLELCHAGGERSVVGELGVQGAGRGLGLDLPLLRLSRACRTPEERYREARQDQLGHQEDANLGQGHSSQITVKCRFLREFDCGKRVAIMLSLDCPAPGRAGLAGGMHLPP